MRDNITGQFFKGIGPISCAQVATPTAQLLRVKFENSEDLKGSAPARGNGRFVTRPFSTVCSGRSRNLSAVLKTKIVSRHPTRVLCRCRNVATAIRNNVTISISLKESDSILQPFYPSPLPPSPPSNTRADLQMPFLCPLSVPCT